MGENDRVDLRDKTIFTIDGADAKDLDDAVSIEKNEAGNYILGVHIADVSNYVPPGSPIDMEALARGTSVYPAGQVIHMLPESLANGVCSLNKGEDRKTLSVGMEITPEGGIIGHSIFKSLICSRERMVYDHVSDMIENKDLKLIEKYDNIYREILLMEELASALRRRWEARGRLDFDINEACIKFGPDGKVESVEVAERRAADRMIEEFMIAANVTVAERVFNAGIPFIYRVHEKPEQEKMEELGVFIKKFGLKLPCAAKNVNTRALAGLVKKIKGEEYENIVNKVMLRSMTKAYYSHECGGHFGLGLSRYCHFTAPIRRYPDLLAHRIIKESLTDRMGGKRKRALSKKIRSAAESSSVAERKALEFEREVEKMKKAEYMSGRIGEVFEGMVSGVTYFGIFVELKNTIEGLVPADFADIEKFTLGDKIKVVLESVDTEKGFINFRRFADE